MKQPNFPPQGPAHRMADAAFDKSLWKDKEEEVGPEAAWGWSASLAHRYLKRLLDLTVSMFALCFVLSWFLPLLCLLILIDTGAPVFFVQKRIGRHNRLFWCIKLRTMRQPMPGQKCRITRLGQWLRNHKLDEIPQFFNVLKGEMSIVGPRPHMLRDHHAFIQVVGDRYSLRHTVLPGITGLAQVSGYEGRVVSPHKLRGRIRLDLFYIRHWSMALEFRIMYRTIRLFITGLWNGLRKTLLQNARRIWRA